MSRPYDYDDGSGSGGNLHEGGSQSGIVGLLRYFWRQLTSMRMALILLLLLALAAVPGSLVPQRLADPNGVEQFKSDHPELFPILDAFPIQAFDVYSSVWFSAIYLLLFVSLIGCIIPRIRHHWRSLRQAPPNTPVRLSRMPGYHSVEISNAEASTEQKRAFATQVVEVAAGLLRSRRYRADVQTRVTRRGEEQISVSAERGYLRETGNLVFHIAMVGLLLAVAAGSGLKFSGQKVLVEGEAMVASYIDFDTIRPGQYFDETTLPPFGMRLDKLEVDYVTPEDENTHAIGQVREYRANVTVIEPDASEHKGVIRVNHPLRDHGASLFLLANGYAPVLKIQNSKGEVVFNEPVPFIPQEPMTMTSLGIVKVPYGLGEQVGMQGFFYPTKVDLDTGAYSSSYPDLENPVLTLDVYTGDLGINDGIPQSVYALDTSKMTPLTGRKIDKESLELTPGKTVDLPNGMGTMTLESVPRYAAFDVMINPSQVWVLAFALIMLAGLAVSLFVPRRRMWVKAILTDEGIRVEYAGLARGDDPNLGDAVEQLSKDHQAKL